MFRAVRLFAIGAVIGVAADRVWSELQKPAADQFPGLRKRVNETVNPWLIEHGIPGSAHTEIATLEHVGRSSGTTYFTPVRGVVRDELVLIPAPLGAGSQWARNIQAAGHARMQFHEMLYELDRPEMITIEASGLLPPQVAAPFDRMGWQVMRLGIGAMVPGAFATHTASMPAVEGVPVMEPPLEGTYEIPVEPRMVHRE